MTEHPVIYSSYSWINVRCTICCFVQAALRRQSIYCNCGASICPQLWGVHLSTIAGRPSVYNCRASICLQLRSVASICLLFRGWCTPTGPSGGASAVYLGEATLMLILLNGISFKIELDFKFSSWCWGNYKYNLIWLKNWWADKYIPDW